MSEQANLSDEGLREMAISLFRKITSRVDVDEVIEIAFALKQVRNAAKKETVEKAAKVVEGKEMISAGYGVLHKAGWNEAIKIAATAIRRME